MTDKALVELFKQLDTTCVSDALDRFGIVGGLEGIKPIVAGMCICGPAFTVHYLPCGTVTGTVGDFLDDVSPGQIVVIDNGGRTHCTVWGDLMSLAAQQHGIEGTVIDGVCRDLPAIQHLRYPIFAKGYFMVTGKDRVQVDGINVPISISGVQVRPYDIVLGDDSGVIVIPQEKAEDVLKIARDIQEKEKIIEHELRSGMSLRQARAKVSYHRLQSKGNSLKGD